MLAAIAALTIVAATGAALVIFASPDASTPAAAIRLSPPPLTSLSFDKADQVARAAIARQEADAAHEQAVVLAQVGRGRVWVQANDGVALRLPQAHGVEIHAVGSILLIVGVVGLILSMPLLVWSSRDGPDGSTRRQAV